MTTAEETIVPSGCAHDCPGRCVLRAHVRDGRIVRITSDDSPFGDRRPLRACARGRAYRQRVYHPDRLLHPLIRTGERGAARFRRATWDEALATVAEGIAAVRDRHGPQSLYIASGAGNMGVLRGDALARRLFGLTGGYLGRHAGYSVAATTVASNATLGTTETANSYDDWVNSRLIILWASSLTDTFTGTGMPYYLCRAKQAGARVVCIDPLYTDTAALADEWIPIRPGTDNALIDAMAYVLITSDLVDRDFVARCCVGFDDSHLPAGAPAGSSYRDHVLGLAGGQPKTPAWASAITGVPAETIVRIAREYGATKPAAILQGWGAQRAAYGEQFVRGGIVLQALTGNIGIPGGSAAGLGAPARQVRLAQVPDPLPAKASVPVYLWTDAVTRHSELTPSAAGLLGVDRLEAPIRLIANWQGNSLINQHADINRTARVLRDPKLVEFVFAVDQFLTPSARFADVVLPAATWFERNDMMSGSFAGDYALFLNQAIEPLGESRGDYWIARALAERMGIEPAFSLGRDELDWLRVLCAESGIPDFDEFRATGIYERQHSEPHIAFADFRADPAGHPLRTPSGKVEIYSTLAAAHNEPTTIPPVPTYIPAWEGCEDPLRARFPLQLLTPHPKHRTHSIYGNLPWIRAISREGVSVSPPDAAARGIATGDRVRVWNDRGTIVVRAIVTQRVMPGVVAIPQGVWHDPDPEGIDRGGCTNTLTSPRTTPWAKGSTSHTCLVEIVREAGQ